MLLPRTGSVQRTNRVRPGGLCWRNVLGTINQALAYVDSVHSAQKSEGIWLADHPFVQAVRVGIARPDEIARWATQVFCITRNLDELVHFHFGDPVAAVFNAMHRDLPLLIQLGGALGVSSLNMLSGEANQTTRKIQQWAKQHISVRDTFLTAQVCLELLESMSPDVGVYLAEGSQRHYGLKSEEIRYFTVRAGTKHELDEHAAELLTLLPEEKWNYIRQETLSQNRLMHAMYNSIGDMWSGW